MRTVNSFCLQLASGVKAGESSGGPTSHLSRALNSRLTPLQLLGPEATQDCQASGPLGCKDIPPEARRPLFPLGFPTFVSHNSPRRNLPCIALIPFPCDFPEICLPFRDPQGRLHHAGIEMEKPQKEARGSCLIEQLEGSNWNS